MDRVRHKTSNRFKFQSFAERVSKINVDVFHRVPHRYEESDVDNSTYLYEAVQKWCTLNLTENFKLFRQEIGHEISTLPQLLNNKEKIVDVFCKHIKLQNMLSLQPVLEMLVAFVKDIRYEFYPYYPKILKELILLLKLKDAEVLESTFTCLAYIFKYLIRELVKDLDKVVLDLAPLLNADNPVYVRDFAAQSFAFVARKVKDREKFLFLILQTIQTQTSSNLLYGSSQLIFHMLCGIKRQSHSCAEELLYTIFSSFGNDTVPQKLLYDLSSNIVTLYGNAIDPKHSVLMPVLHKVLLEKIKNMDDKSMKSIRHILKLIKESLQCRSGAILQESLVPDMSSAITNLIVSTSDSKTKNICIDICADILTLNKISIPQEIASFIVIKVMETKDEDILLNFMEKITIFSGFESVVLPKALQIFSSSGSQAFLQTLAKVICSKIGARSRDYDIFHTPVYVININNSTLRLKNMIMEKIDKFDSNQELADEVLYALIILRHITPSDGSKNVKILLEFIRNIVKSLNGDGQIKNKKQLFALCTAFETLLYFRGDADNVNIEYSTLYSSILSMLKNNDSLQMLRVANLVLSISQNVKFSNTLIEETYKNMELFIQSPHSNARFLALHCLHSLYTIKAKPEDPKNNMINVLQICLNCEVIPLSISDYREKIKELQKLKFQSLPPLNDCEYGVLIKYILGVLYCNFQLLWEPIFEILATYAENMPKTFWAIFYQKLCFVTDVCREKKNPRDYSLPDVDEFLLNSARFINVDDRADYKNYRFLMWKAMTYFVDLCESKNRDIVPMYLNFLKEELFKSNSNRHSLTINIKVKEANFHNSDEGKDDDDYDDDKGKMTTEPHDGDEKPHKSSLTHVIKWAVAHLNLLSKFQSPKLCFKEAEVRNSYYDLLLHKNLEIQKLALECIFTYKFKSIMPYKQNLRNLIDDMKFRHEKLNFQSDKENGCVQDNHREHLMPLVMRILYNKMVSKHAVKRGNKGFDVSQKRSIIFRFLSGCTDSEIELFFKMAFKTFEIHPEAQSADFLKLMNSVDLEHVIPPKKLKNVINLAGSIIDNFGGLMTLNIQRFILKILFSVGAVIAGIFSQREYVFTGFMASIKSLRSENADCLSKFFERLNYPWRDDEINAVFEIFIWPSVEKLPVEGFYNPTSVLKLFSTWSDNPRYFKLFAKHKPNDKNISPLPFIMKLLLNEKAQSSVLSCIIDIIEKLLTLKEDVTDDVEMMEDSERILDFKLNVTDILDIDQMKCEKLLLKEDINYGSKILLPHVSSVLTYLRRKLEKSNAMLQKTELNVLSRITELATSPENADCLMTILLRLLTVKKITDEEILMNTLTTIENLTKVVVKPISYIRSFAILLGSLEILEQRKILIQSLLNMQSRCPELKECVDIIHNLNSYNSKWIHEPDFDRRLEAYKQIRLLAEKGTLDLNLAIMVLHDCFYVIRCEADMSLRDNAAFCLKEICPILAIKWSDNKIQSQFWVDSILKLIHTGIIGQNENMQSFSISFLGVMARQCGDIHPVLNDLSLYTNKADLEIDIFENSIHLQLHRRLRALLRFCTISKSLKHAPNSRTLVQFILPLATQYLCNEKYAEKNTLIDSAIKCIGTVCKFLPWQKYQTLLRYYLSKFRGKIEYQRQLVRVVIAILDSFHFDISQSTATTMSVFKKGKTDYIGKGTIESEKEISDKTNNSNTEENEILSELHEEDKVETENSLEAERIKGKRAEQKVIPAFETVTVLSPEDATKVEYAMSGPLLTQLTKAIGERSQRDDTHKTNYKNLGTERDQEEVMRIPIAVTLVKLLQNISKKLLDHHLPGIVMKLCTFLKSKMESVRRATRETLQQIMVSLGPKYLKVILTELNSSLTKGFQLHVLSFTMHAVIQSIQSQLQPGDMDENLPILLEVCKTDIFGLPAEEKTVAQIQVKHKEVRSSKSYRLMNLIAQHITHKCLTDALLPIKDVLLTSHSHKVINRCRECLRHVILGLCANEFITTENLLIYVYGVTSESIPNLSLAEQVQEKEKKSKEKIDCYIIPEQPKSRTGVLSNPVKKNAKSNVHVLLAFGFQLLQFLLKKEKLKNTQDFKSYLDPMGPILVKAVQSQQVKVSTLALNCLCKIFKYDLPSVRKGVSTVISELFAILHKYAAPGLRKGETFDLVLVTFKAICVIIRDTNYEGIDCNKLKILLVYVEQDIYDNNRQASAFNLLKVILKKKLNVPELNDLMLKVAELSISSEVGHVRLQARQCVFQYIMDYPLGKQLEYFISFFVSQLSFSVESGRQSALEMIHSFITSFPEEVLNEQCGLFFVTLGARLINDDSPECKKAVSGIVKSMLMRLDESHRDQLFDILKLWLKEKKISHRRLSAQVMGIFVTMEKTNFSKRLPSLIPLIHQQFAGDGKPGQFVRVPSDDEDKENAKDYHLFQILQLLLKICMNCPKFLTDPANQESIHFFSENSQCLLCHPHEWVRLAAMQFLGCVFNSIEPDKVSQVLNGEEVEQKLSFLESSSLRRRVRSLILDHVTQLIPGVNIGKDLLEQVTKNLVYFARVLKNFKEPEKDEIAIEADEVDENMKGNLSLLWLIRKMRGIVNKEIVETPTSYILRTGVFKWIGAIAVCFSRTEVTEVLYNLIAPVIRERDLVKEGEESNPFNSLIIEVTNVLKSKVGVEEFTKQAVKARKALLEKRNQRKTQRAQEFVTNPERAAKRKIDKQIKKKMLKKRKIEAFKKEKGKKWYKDKRKAQQDIFV